MDKRNFTETIIVRRHIMGGVIPHFDFSESTSPIVMYQYLQQAYRGRFLQ